MQVNIQSSIQKVWHIKNGEEFWMFLKIGKILKVSVKKMQEYSKNTERHMKANVKENRTHFHYWKMIHT